jgi:hypothetical protein
MTAPDQKLEVPMKLTSGKVVEILIESALESAVNAFLVMLMGSIALEIVSGVAKEMTPSSPPGMYWSKAAGSANAWSAPLREHSFLICSALFFIPTAYFRLRTAFRPVTEPGPATRLQKIGRRLSEGWFGLVVGNAFGAMISAMVVGWVQQFSITQMVFHWLADGALPYLRAFTSWALGEPLADNIGNWLAWFSQNQLKFTFWFLYLASVCDDLGIPNLKSLARWAWRRSQKNRKAMAPAPAASEDIAK